MPPTAQSFSEIWTRRAFKDWREHISATECSEWLQTLSDSHVGSWYRVIVSEWCGEHFSKTSQAWQVAGWLHDACEGAPLFVTPRGRSSITFGVQIWMAHEQHVPLVQLMATRVNNVREFSQAEFVAHMEMTFERMVK